MSNFTEIQIASPDAGGGSSASAVSWGAIIAGAVAAAAATLLMMIVTTGLGFAAVSPWPNSGISGTTFTYLTAAWLIGVHALASAVGGYMAGRLRTRWTGLHTDEVYFRDTAHGFLSWATGMIVGALFLGSVIASTLGAGAQATGSLLNTAAQSAMQQNGGNDSSSHDD